VLSDLKPYLQSFRIVKVNGENLLRITLSSTFGIRIDSRLHNHRYIKREVERICIVQRSLEICAQRIGIACRICALRVLPLLSVLSAYWNARPQRDWRLMLFRD
jgi:hypothetical protein